MIECHATVLCNCGREHPSFDDWQKCQMALTPRPIEAWWRGLRSGMLPGLFGDPRIKPGVESMTTSNAAPSEDCPYCGLIHKAICPRIKRVEYSDMFLGQFKVVEFFAPNEKAQNHSAASIFEKDIYCKNCRFFAEDEDECHRRAPTPRFRAALSRDSEYLLACKDADDEGFNSARWPEVRPLDWCGEFEERADSVATRATERRTRASRAAEAG